MPRNYSQEFRDCAVGLVFDWLRDNLGGLRAAIISDTGIGLALVMNHLVVGWFKLR